MTSSLKTLNNKKPFMNAHPYPQMPQIAQPQDSLQNSSNRQVYSSQKDHRTHHTDHQDPETALAEYKRKDFTTLKELNSLSCKQFPETLAKNNATVANRANISATDQAVNDKIYSKLFSSQRLKSMQKLFKNKTEAKQKNNFENIESAVKKDLQSAMVQKPSAAASVKKVSIPVNNPQINCVRRELFQQQKQQQQQQKQAIQGLLNDSNDILACLASDEQYSSSRDQQSREQEADKEFSESQPNQENYIFGQQGTNLLINDMMRGRNKSSKMSKNSSTKKKKKIMPPPSVQPFTRLIQKSERPENWRLQNHYIPKSEQERRMDLQHISKQMQNLQLKREQSQIFKLMQEYHLNKKALQKQTQRKIENNKAMQKIYKAKRGTTIYNQKSGQQPNHHSASLPSLKVPKVQVVLEEAPAPNLGQTNQITNLLAKRLDSQKPNQQLYSRAHIRKSMSYSKLGFGTQESRKLHFDEVYESQMENLEKIQKKFRQKGIKFNSVSMQKGLLNLRQYPIYKMSNTQQNNNGNAIKANPQQSSIPQKQLPSNAYYKLYPI